ncbi:hypothetical protein ACSBR2_021937 [Camellia fascicularis]
MEDFIIDSLKKNLSCRFTSLPSSLSPGIENLGQYSLNLGHFLCFLIAPKPNIVNLKPKVPTKAVCAEHLESRKEILTLLNLQKQILIVVALGFQSLSVLFVSNGGMLDNDTSNGMMRNLLLSFFLSFPFAYVFTWVIV